MTSLLSFAKLAFLVFLLFLTHMAAREYFVPVLDTTNLIIHEAGHVVFMFFGDFIAALGGSLLQLVLPLALALSFLRKWQIFSALVMLWWAGENLVSIGLYVADANTQTLPLIGGDHDFAFILSHYPSVMVHADAIGRSIIDIGIVIMLAAIAFAAYLVIKNEPAWSGFLKERA